MDEVTAALGIAKTTIYRRWPTEAHLVLEVVATLQATVEAPDTGDLRADLQSVTTGLLRALAVLRRGGVAHPEVLVDGLAGSPTSS